MPYIRSAEAEPAMRAWRASHMIGAPVADAEVDLVLLQVRWAFADLRFFVQLVTPFSFWRSPWSQRFHHILQSPPPRQGQVPVASSTGLLVELAPETHPRLDALRRVGRSTGEPPLRWRVPKVWARPGSRGSLLVGAIHESDRSHLETRANSWGGRGRLVNLVLALLIYPSAMAGWLARARVRLVRRAAWPARSRTHSARAACGRAGERERGPRAWAAARACARVGFVRRAAWAARSRVYGVPAARGRARTCMLGAQAGAARGRAARALVQAVKMEGLWGSMS